MERTEIRYVPFLRKEAALKARRFISLLLVFIMCFGMISASAEEVYPDVLQSTEVESETEIKMQQDIENETELKPDDVSSETEESETEEPTQIPEQPIRMFDNCSSEIALLSGNLKICFGLPDNRLFTNSDSPQGGAQWKIAGSDDNIGVVPGTSWFIQGWYDTYGVTLYFNADGSPNHLLDTGGLVIAKWNTDYVNTFYNYNQYRALNINPDLYSMSEYDAWYHFLMYGMAEGRRTSYVFDPKMYKSLYQDVANAFGDSGWSNYYMHFAMNGRKEGRWGNYNTMTFDPNGGTCSTKSMYTSYSEAVGTTPYVHDKASLPTPTRAGYEFLGWYTANNEAITAGMNCYWVNDLTVYAHWKEIGKATVTVNHYKQNVSGNGYTLAATESVSGSIGSRTTPAVRKYTGFTAPKTQTVTIPNGGTSVNYYYSRNKYSVTVNTDNGIATTSGAGTYYYDAAVTVAITPKAGYKINSVTASSGISNPYNFTMPAGNVTITATSTMSDVTDTVPLCLIAGESDTSFVITADNAGGVVTIEVPETLQFIQENKEQVINGNIQLSANTLTADRHQITGTVTTEKFSAGSWKASFNINIKYQAE